MHGVNTGERLPDRVLRQLHHQLHRTTMEVARRRLGAERAVMTTVHAYTAHQHLVDGPSKNFRQGRAGAANLVPASTGAAQATIRPFRSWRAASTASPFEHRSPWDPSRTSSLLPGAHDGRRGERVFRQEAESARYAGILGVSEDPLVSADIIGDSRAAVVDLDLTRVVDGRLVKVLAWYDNEWGFTNQMIREVRAILGLTHRQRSARRSDPDSSSAADEAR